MASETDNGFIACIVVMGCILFAIFCIVYVRKRPEVQKQLDDIKRGKLNSIGAKIFVGILVFGAILHILRFVLTFILTP